eukprot:TRINITY_DN6129_c0_g1_i5.p1 TRINITY_DN6129_c0_g1~~TRINITY_DN6129_c0_g1_i5.p1  ORF type:complete len:375 (+),score=91.09 TRINITY_DN6129_c0_g1_i5:42-1127(+)
MSNTTDSTQIKKYLETLKEGLPINLTKLPKPERDPKVPHAPKRTVPLSQQEKKLALRNALRYFPKETHSVLAPEFAEELELYGHIYMYRFRPNYVMKAYPIDLYPAKTVQDPNVAQFPHELVTYGGNGSVFQNWAQYHVTMKFLSEMTEEQTLTMCSGHPQGLFPSSNRSPRVIITNGMVIPQYSSQEDYDKMNALGVSMYGQMTAGSYCYIGPQGIVHGTTITLLNAGRKYLGNSDLNGKVFVSSGLGGMSGAQTKAGSIAGVISVVAEIDEKAVIKRHSQGWVTHVVKDLDECISKIKEFRSSKETTSIAYVGNVVDLWEKLAAEEELLVELGSDQTSLHNPYNGGYYPVGISVSESNR